MRDLNLDNIDKGIKRPAGSSSRAGVTSSAGRSDRADRAEDAASEASEEPGQETQPGQETSEGPGRKAHAGQETSKESRRRVQSEQKALQEPGRRTQPGQEASEGPRRRVQPGQEASDGPRRRMQPGQEASGRRRVRARQRASSSQIILIGFLSVIMIGTFLLMLPAASKASGSVGFFNALFTATSAVCVTGLVVLDTATSWSLFGQIVILLLIQIGGLGVITMLIAVSVIMKRRIGLSERSTMQTAISAPQVGGIIKFTKFILAGTAIAELSGAALLAPAFIRDFGIARGLWYALFHSISAFCNAGFDLMGINEPYSSFTAYADAPYVNTVLMILIVVGGLGFLTWDDLKTTRFQWKRCRMQTKVVLSVTCTLLIVPTMYFFLFEFRSLPLGERLLASAFSSVTARTAGFNTVDFGTLSETGLMLMIILMIIGGSPGSTAGGMKTTTVAVLMFSTYSLFRQQQSTHLFRRRIPEETVRSAATLLVLYLTASVGGAMVISYVEGVPMITALFETASAVATVGLSLGLTPTLHLPSRLILIFLMYIGRVGGLTVIFATVAQRRGTDERFPQEKITVG